MTDSSILGNFATAILIGALVGIEREKRKRDEADPRGSGLRTFILMALLGAVGGWMSEQSGFGWMLPVTLGVLGVLLVTGYVLDVTRSGDAHGFTTEVAAVGVFLFGAMTTLGQRELAVGLAIITAAVLAYKQPLHTLVQRLGWDDVFAGLRLLIATFIVLPLLPDRFIDPWLAINPHRLWLLVLLIAGMSLVGYVATRWLGEGRGAALTGFTGGLVSSTAVTLSFARQSKLRDDTASARALATGVLLAWCVMFGRMLVEAAVVNRAIVIPLLFPLLGMGAVCAAGALWLYRLAPAQAASPDVSLRNPFSLLSAISFGAIFAVVLLVVKLVQQYLPGQGQYVVAWLAGLLEVDAITLSMADYAKTGSPQVAVNAIVIAAFANTFFKCGVLVVLGGRAIRRSMLVATGAVMLAGLAIMLFA